MQVNVKDKKLADDIPLDGQVRFSQSHPRLDRVFLMMQDGFEYKQTSMPRRKTASPGNIPLHKLPHQSELKQDDSSDDSDKEEHIVQIDDPKYLFHNSRREL